MIADNGIARDRSSNESIEIGEPAMIKITTFGFLVLAAAAWSTCRARLSWSPERQKARVQTIVALAGNLAGAVVAVAGGNYKRYKQWRRCVVVIVVGWWR
jgi:hypothetical protein